MRAAKPLISRTPLRLFATLLALAASAAGSISCRTQVTAPPPSSALRPATTAVDSPLFLHYPQLDQRIVRLDPAKPTARRRYYPDLWHADLRAVRDFVVDGARIYALLASSDLRANRALFVVDLQTGKLLRRVTLESEPSSLAWIGAKRLAVCHATPPVGPAGRVTVVDTAKLAIERSVELRGACQSIAIDAASGARAALIERMTRSYGGDTLVHHRLVTLDLATDKRLAERELPGGARSVTLGPRGLLYVSFASGGGLHATDATLTVYHPDDLRLLSRLKLEMVTRVATTHRGRLVLGLLHRGEAWLAAIDPASRETRFDLRFGRLVVDQLAIVGDVAYLPLRGEHALERVDLKQDARLPRLQLGKLPQGRERVTLLRTERAFEASAKKGGR